MKVKDTRDTENVAELQGQLPLQITGIVFWCTVLIGLLLAMLQLDIQEQEILQHNQDITNTLAADIALLQAEGTEINLDSLESYTNETLSKSSIKGFSVKTGGETFSLGTISGDKPLSPKSSLNKYLQKNAVQPIDILVYPYSVSEQLIFKRKKLLITMGLLFSAFGFFLQWLLKRVLTRPFQKMINTAKRFTDGHTEVRFTADGQDEFSYLGRFFNQALDFLSAQQQELRGALQRLVESEVELYREKEKAEVTLHSIGDAVITTDREGRIEYLNPMAEKLTGFSLTEVRGKEITSVLILVDEDSRDPVANPVVVCMQQGITCELAEHTLLLGNQNQEVAIADSAAPIRDRDDIIIGAVMVFHDVGHARKLAKQLSYQASHDQLTDLFNRAAFEEKLSLALESAQHQDKHHVFFYLDLDQFKIVNDTCGHIAGDELLKLVASILQSRLRDSDILARLGGDEFGVLLHDCTVQDAGIIADKLRQGIHDFRFMYEHHSFEIGVSIGVVSITPDTRNITDIYANADMACYAAKDAGRNRVHIYESGDQELQLKRGEMRWLSRIQIALDENRYTLLCQPITPIDDPSLTTHYEVLLRMIDEDNNLIPPMAFIPAAERYNVMPLLDRWVFDNLFAHIEANSSAQSGVVWNMNLSGNSLSDTDFLNHIIAKIESTSIPASLFCFEITETAAIAKLSAATNFIERLRKAGCSFALDDFGSGLSSFGYLKTLGVQFLKIDGSFIQDIVSDPVDKAMVQAIHNVGEIMNLKTIAEFVENDSILDELKSIGVNYAQGFGIAKPRPLQSILDELPQ